jgi:glycine C-acetyltransferase
MSLQKLTGQFAAQVAELEAKGTAKGKEKIVTGLKAAAGGFSERYYLAGYGDRAFLRMNSNSYLGLALHRQVIEAEARAAERFGTGPGAVRFISGTYQPHVELEAALASFHGREAAMVMSAAYATVVGVLPQLVTNATVVISDALNHNSIITAVRLCQPADKAVYAHVDMRALDKRLDSYKGRVKRACVVTDGVFSMRGDHAPLDELVAICHKHEPDYDEGIITIVDDSHGVGALGSTGAIALRTSAENSPSSLPIWWKNPIAARSIVTPETCVSSTIKSASRLILLKSIRACFLRSRVSLSRSSIAFTK